MRKSYILALLSILLVPLACAQDVVGYGAKDTCKSALEAEAARGSKLIVPPAPPNPVMKDFYGTTEYERTQSGTPVLVTYLCTGTKASGGQIAAQLIHINRASEHDTQLEFQRQRQLPERQLGAPCMDPTQRGNQQRPHVENDGTTETLLPNRVTWKVRPDVVTDIQWWKVRGVDPEKWQILISTHATSAVGPGGGPYQITPPKSDCAAYTQRRNLDRAA